MDNIVTIIEASKELGVSRVVVSTLVKTHGLKPKPVPRNGKAKGLDRDDMLVLRRALGLPADKRSRPRPVAQP